MGLMNLLRKEIIIPVQRRRNANLRLRVVFDTVRECCLLEIDRLKDGMHGLNILGSFLDWVSTGHTVNYTRLGTSA